MYEVSPWLEVSQRDAPACILTWSKSNLVYIKHITYFLLFYSTANTTVLYSVKKKKKSGVLDCVGWVLLTFKCNCVFLLIDERRLGLLCIYFDSTNLESVCSLKSLWMSCSRGTWSSINTDPASAFSIKPMGAFRACANITQVRSTRCNYWQAAPWIQNVLQGCKRKVKL